MNHNPAAQIVAWLIAILLTVRLTWTAYTHQIPALLPGAGQPTPDPTDDPWTRSTADAIRAFENRHAGESPDQVWDTADYETWQNLHLTA